MDVGQLAIISGEWTLLALSLASMIHHYQELQLVLPGCKNPRVPADRILCRLYIRQHRTRIANKFGFFTLACWMLYVPNPNYTDVWEMVASIIFRWVLVIMVMTSYWESQEAKDDRTDLQIVVSSTSDLKEQTTRIENISVDTNLRVRKQEERSVQ